MPSLGLVCIASATPDDVEVEIIDENIEELHFEETDIVGISTMTPTAHRAYEIADKYRGLGSKVILGGIHPSILPQEAIEHADGVVIGEADEIWPQVIQDFARNKLQRFYIAEQRPDLSKLPSFRRDLIRRNKYFVKNPAQTSRGCPVNCDFCSVSRFNGTRVRHRPIKDVVHEIEGMEGGMTQYVPFADHNITDVLFVDDNIAADPKYSRELFKALKPLNIRWASQTSILLAKDSELLQLAVESGCRIVFIGFESLRQDALKEVHKDYLYRTEEYREVIKVLHDHRIAIEAAFIFGLDSDDKDVFKRTVDFCYETNIQVAQFTILTPFPGTASYKRLEKEGRIISRDWRMYDAFHTVFRPLQMLPEELQEGVEKAYKEFYSLKSSAKRIACMMPKLGPQYAPLLGLINYDFYRFAI